MNYQENNEDKDKNEVFKEEVIFNKENREEEFADFHKGIQGRLNNYNDKHGTMSFSRDNSTGIDSLVANEKMILVKAFVNDSGEIENEYSVINKAYLGLIKKISNKLYENKKNGLDDKIIEKYAKKRLNELEALAKDATECADATSLKRKFYLEMHTTFEREYNESLNEAEHFNKTRKECTIHLESLKEKKKEGEISPELFNEYLQAKNDENELSKCFRHANKRANSIKERMEVNYPRYIETDLYSEALVEQALSLSVAHEFYSNLYEDMKTARAIKLKAFVDWNNRMDTFFGEYNKRVDQSAKLITDLFKTYKNSNNILEGDHVLEKYRQLIQDSHEELLASLKEAKTGIMDLEI